LLLIEFAHDAADRIYKAIVQSSAGEKALKPILRPFDTLGSTRYVDFDTTRPVYATDPTRCHISHVVADTDSWEQKMAQSLEELGQEGLVLCYVKNHNLGFTIPYTLNGEEHNYIPDFIVRIKPPSPLAGDAILPPLPLAGEGRGEGGKELNLIIEVTGKKDKDKEAKTTTARTLWIPAVNNHGSFGRWAFLEISDPWDAKNAIRSAIR
jgi:type III restriction enzyme